jgi:membrane fusion protein (multidrug efflux system)
MNALGKHVSALKGASLSLAAILLVGGAAVFYLTRSGPDSAAAAPNAPDTPATLVVVEPVATRMFTDVIEALGTSTANESVTLTAKLTDTVSKVSFGDGDFVEAGQVLVELTNQEQTAVLAEEKANLDDARRQLERIEDLVKRNSVPVSQADEARARYAASRARYDAVVARLDDRLIRAPFAGVLGFRRVSPGTLVTPGTPITTIDDVSIIKLDFTVPEVYLSALSPGQQVKARSPAFPNETFEGELKTIGSRVDPVTRSVVARAHIDNPERRLRPGMLLTVQVTRTATSALAVREAALQQVASRTFVYVAKDGRATQRDVTTGQRQPGFVEIKDGLALGEPVVTEGLIKLRNGAPIRTTAESPTESTTGWSGEGQRRSRVEVN